MRVNLASNYTFLNGSTVGWNAENGASMAYTTDYAFFGEGSLQVTKSATNGSGVTMSAPIPVQAGLPYAVSIYARLPITIPESEVAPLTMTVVWSNSLGSVVGTTTSGELDIADDTQWSRLSGVWTAPVGATLISEIRVFQAIAGGVGQKFIIDALLVEQAAYVGGFFFTYTQDQKMALVQKVLTPGPQIINGLRLGADVSLNNLTFNTIDEWGTIWVMEDIKGWDGQTAPEMPDIGRGTDDGSYDVEGRLTSRALSVSGFFIPANGEEALTHAKDVLVQSIDLVRKGGWLRLHTDPTRAAWVRLSGAPDIQTINERGRTRFTVTLRAPDPIKYHWDDGDPEGFSRAEFEHNDYAALTNIGNAHVSGVFTITGPVGPGSYVYNSATDQIMEITEPLRAAAVVGSVIKMASYQNEATLTTSEYNGLRVGDEVELLGLPVPFTTPGKRYVITKVSEVFPFSFSFEIFSDDIDEVDVDGQVSLANPDVLVVDTYEKTVMYNGEMTGHRYRLTTLTDWIKFAPGSNPIEFYDEPARIPAASKTISGTTATVTTSEIHYLSAGDQVYVYLPETAALSRKSLTSNVVTITTQEPHGFSVGDTVNVVSTESSQINYKARTSNTVTLTTVEEHGISVGDAITVTLPVTAVTSQKQLTTNVATITTQNPHGFSVGDSVTIVLPTAATVAGKSLTNNVAVLMTTTGHGFSVGDTIVVTMPAGATVVGKERVGSISYIDTSVAHGFSVGDTVVMTLPTTATMTGNAQGDNNQLVTVTTSGAHNFSVGDRVSFSGFAHSAWNGTQIIESVTSTTFTFRDWTASSSKFATTSGVSLTNLTNQSYNGTKTLISASGSTFAYNS